LASTGKKWLIGCGSGCTVSALLLIVITVGTGFMMSKPFSKAVDAQQELTASFGAREEFVPLCQGVTADRVEAFLQIRDALMGECQGFQEIQAKFKVMDELDKGEDEVSKGEVVKGVGNIMGAVFSIGPKIGHVTLVRNEALLANEMSLGEYNWLFILIYYSWLEYPPNTGFDTENTRGLTGTERALVLTMMESHAADCEINGDTASAKIWRDEAARMQRAGEGVPFKDKKLPQSLVKVLQPYQQELDNGFCAAMAEFELGSIKKTGPFGFQTE